MSKVDRPFWQLLLQTSTSKAPDQLTCEECFALLEYDAELLVGGAAIDEIRPAVSYHLSLCPECQAKIDEWLGKLGAARPHLHSR
jgi:hypothetical protein